MRVHGEPNKRDFSHYSPELLLALHHFQDLYITYMNIPTWRLKENPQRAESVQTAWNEFIRLREKETGYRYYVPPSEHK